MKVRIKVRPTGYVSLDGGPLTAWPPVGTVVDLPEAMAEDLVTGGRPDMGGGGRPQPISAPGDTRPAHTADAQPPATRPTARKGASTGE